VNSLRSGWQMDPLYPSINTYTRRKLRLLERIQTVIFRMGLMSDHRITVMYDQDKYLFDAVQVIQKLE
jgi:hypothetical protein